jgi:UDP-N-acetylmuramoylalanine--D-glutamate ligase
MTTDYHGQHAAVLGLGRSGVAAARLLLDAGARVTVLDSGDPASRQAAAELLSSRGARVVLGNDALRCAQEFDFAVLSPGIDPAVPLARRPVEAGIPLLGEIELACRHCRCPIVAVTGTNGKTTTTGLIAALLSAAGLSVEACGNIGLPFSEVAARSAALDAVVVEVSSFQLETTETFRPRVAVWTNFSANHLDRYPDVASYRAAKLRIFERQTADDFAVVNAREELPFLRARRVTFTAARAVEADFTLDAAGVIRHGGEAVIALPETRLRGPHNAENLMAALGAGLSLGVDLAAMLPGARTFTAPPHRCEFVAEIDGVTWINDSKSTNLDALEQALRGPEGGIVLIAGGKDKGFAFAPLAGLVGARVHDAVLLGELREAIARDWAGAVPCHPVDSLGAAVAQARRLARPGDTVLFSPGTSSFDMFRDYEERGDCFKQLTLHLNSNHTKTS